MRQEALQAMLGGHGKTQRPMMELVMKEGDLEEVGSLFLFQG